MAATNGHPVPVMAAITCPPRSLAVVGLMAGGPNMAAIAGPWDHCFVAVMVGPRPSWIAIAGPRPRIETTNGPGPTKA